MKSLSETIKIENERNAALNSKFIPYFRVNASYCTIKQDAIDLFYVWITTKGILRTFAEADELEGYINECIESFRRLFIDNNKYGESILINKGAMKRLYYLIYYAQPKIYEALKNEGHISNEDNLGNRYNPSKAKWFNDLPTADQLDIEGVSQKEIEELFKQYKASQDANKGL